MLEAWSVDESAEGLAVVEVGAVADGAPASYDHNKVYIYIHIFGRGRVSTDLHDDHPNPFVNG